MEEIQKGQEQESRKIDKFMEFVDRAKQNPWKITSLVFGLACLILLFLALSPAITGNVIGGKTAGDSLVDYLNSRTGGGVEYVSYEDLGNIYQVTVKYKGQEIPVYVTKDGKYFVSGVQPITGQAVNQNEQPESQEVPKSDKPKVEAFVFSYCPYGLQFEKALLPVYKLLKDKADIEIVAIGAMHGEYEKLESLRQICIEKEYGKDKLWDYLEKFMGNKEIGDCRGDVDCSTPLIEKIMSQLGIDKEKINSCMESDAETIYKSQNSRASELGISGSPTFVINGVKVSVARNPEAIKEAICNAFNTEPKECSQTLSKENASPWFGYSTSAGSSGQC